MGSRRNVLRNMFQSMVHPHKWEWNKSSLPQKQLAVLSSFFPPPCFKFPQLRKQEFVVFLIWIMSSEVIFKFNDDIWPRDLRLQYC